MGRLTKWVRAVRAAGLDGKPILHKPDWVERAIFRAGVLPPEQAAEAVRAGRVTVDGRVVLDPLTLVRPDDRIECDGRPVPRDTPVHVVAFHKPAGCVCSRVDTRGRPTVFALLNEVLPPELARFGWHAVGRLDLDTTGLLLFSNDERVVRHVTLPETHLPKRYLAEVGGFPSEERLEPIRQGVLLHDGPARPALARLRGERHVELTITEGRKHQVKRMLRAVWLPVRTLHREAVGGVELALPPLGWRLLSDAEVCEGLGFRPQPRT